jgi:hypothetical protein
MGEPDRQDIMELQQMLDGQGSYLPLNGDFRH